MNQVVIDTKTPIGKLAVTYEGEYVRKVELAPRARPSSNKDPFAREIEKQLRTYFSGAWRGLKLSFLFPADASEFQMRVWHQIRRIPYGKTRSYSEIAYDINSHHRSVASACQANRLLLIIPCHRVVGKKGLCGWAGKTSAANKRRQQWLIEHEQKHKEKI